MATNQVQLITMVLISFFILDLALYADATCYAQSCSSYTSGCSTNTNCVCFQLANGTGMCAAQTSTSSFRGCNSNLTCADNSTVCVINSCFGQPLCYPLLYADYSVCPPSASTLSMSSTRSTTSYSQSGGGGQGNGGLNLGEGLGAVGGASIGVELGVGATVGIVAAVVVVVVVVVIIVVLLLMIFKPC
ncbi:unnamed protein product [Adineta ricciae]|uniref:Uncharacterized protein n=1 Tax=Adineta ricciae TaxID=249248 RepID=A0A814ZZA4_ADIRI|nr:unnamed protein product [Adineta ricciae]